jgi:hypothetical protein
MSVAAKNWQNGRIFSIPKFNLQKLSLSGLLVLGI